MTQRERQLLNWIEENPMISQQELAEKAGITRSSVAVHISNLMKKGYIAGKGYVVRRAPYVAVVGGVTKDIGGRPFHSLVRHDSNPGTVQISLGGVGRNIAHNMSLLGLDVRFVTALGDDAYAQRVVASCGELGIDLSHSLVVKGGRTSTYLFISNPAGDMELALSDTEIYEQMTPEVIRQRMDCINNAKLVILDTNLPQDTIEALAEDCRVPIFADPVSTAKAVKLKNVLGRLHTLKPNRIEAELLTGIEITDRQSLERAAGKLLDTGLQRVFISLSSDGVYAADHIHSVMLPCLPAHLVNATGGGDAFMAALGYAWLEELDLEQSARTALAASAIAVEGEETINPQLSVEALELRMTSH